MNYGIMRVKGIKGTNGWRSYKSNDTKKQMENDIRGNGYTVVRIFTEEEVNEIKNLSTIARIGHKKYSKDEIDFVVNCF